VKPKSKIRREWVRTLFATSTADRPQAEAAVGNLYVAAGFEKPRHFLWFDSPLQASWAVATGTFQLGVAAASGKH
jgi:hypothetical protein